MPLANPEPFPVIPELYTDALTVAVARAFRWQELIESGKVPSVSALAEREEIDESFIRRQLRLTLHPPRLIEELLCAGDGMTSIEAAVRQEPQTEWFCE
jgi:hypothetical protein